MTGVKWKQVADPNPGGVHRMFTMVGADLHITTVQTNGARRRRDIWHRYCCTCPVKTGKWYRWNLDARVQAEVHARLHHGAEPDRGKWRNPNVEVA